MDPIASQEDQAVAPRLALLSYMNRSGSTFLAKELDHLMDVQVTLEADFPFGRDPVRTLSSTAQVEGYLDSLFNDRKFRAWGVSRNRVKERLESAAFPLGFRTILEKVVPLAFCEERSKVIVYKARRLPFRRGFAREFKDVPVIFIDRDPRAIFASQKSARTSSTGQQMGKDVVRFVLSYKAVRDQLNKHLRDWHVVRYEDLVADVEKEVESVAQYLGVEHNRSEDSSYAQRIPAEQAHLHPDIANPPDVSRTTSWKEDLSRLELHFIQETLRQNILDAGYKLEICGGLSLNELLRKCIWWIRFSRGRLRRKTAGVLRNYVGRSISVRAGRGSTRYI